MILNFSDRIFLLVLTYHLSPFVINSSVLLPFVHLDWLRSTIVVGSILPDRICDPLGHCVSLPLRWCLHCWCLSRRLMRIPAFLQEIRMLTYTTDRGFRSVWLYNWFSQALGMSDYTADNLSTAVPPVYLLLWVSNINYADMWYDARSLALLLDFANLSGTVKVTSLSQTGHASAGNMHSYDVHVAHMCGSTPVDIEYYSPENGRISRKKGWLEHDPFLLKWSLSRWHLNFRRCTWHKLFILVHFSPRTVSCIPPHVNVSISTFKVISIQ